MSSLKGQAAFITGGASGLGRAIAEGLAREGANVAIGDLAAAVQDAAREMAERTGGTVLGLQLDVADEAQVQRAIHTAVDRFGGLHVLGNVAGVYGRSPVLEMSPDTWDRTIATNLRGTFLCTRFALPHMVAQGYGRIVNIVSGLGVTGVEEGSAYAASKAAIVAFTKSVAVEVAARGVTVNCLAPGITDTPLLRATYTPEEIQRASARYARGVGHPEDVVGPFLFLVGEASKTINGTTLWTRSP